MAKAVKTPVLLPVGRIVQGSLTEPQTKDGDGNPLVHKDGPNKGQPRLNFYFAVAIAKTPGLGWWQEPWGKVIYDAGVAAWPNGATQNAAFSWKVSDGDDQRPNLKGKRPCDQEGFAGHWIVRTSSGFPPTVYDAKATSVLPDPTIVKAGYFIQLAANVSSNESQSKPGIYINHDMVAFAGYGPEIFQGRDPSEVGFGQGPVPAGMTAVPQSNAQFPGQQPPAMGAMPGYGAPGVAPGMAAMPGAQPQAYGAPQMPAGMPAGPAMGAMPGYGAPGMQPGAQPGMQPGMQPQVAVHPNPGAMGVGMPGAAPQMPGAMPGYAAPVYPAAGGAMPGVIPGAMPGGYPAPGQPQPMPPQAPRSLNDRRMGAALAWDMNAMIAGGWDEQKLIQAGHITPY